MKALSSKLALSSARNRVEAEDAKTLINGIFAKLCCGTDTACEVAEIIGEAMLGPSTTEGNWLLLTLDATRFREAPAMEAAAEEVLAELRNCPPAPGFDRVEIPGEREREHRKQSKSVAAVPEQTWQ